MPSEEVERNALRGVWKPEFVSSDFAAVGSLARGGGLGEVDLVYVPIPEPSSVVLFVFGPCGALVLSWSSKRPRPRRLSSATPLVTVR